MEPCCHKQSLNYQNTCGVLSIKLRDREHFFPISFFSFDHKKKSDYLHYDGSRVDTAEHNTYPKAEPFLPFIFCFPT